MTGGVFKCFPDSPQAVIYRTVLHGTVNATTTELISHIEQWIIEEPTVTVQRVLLTIDGSCSVRISSLTDKEECPKESQNSSSLDNTEIIIIGGLVSLMIVTVTAATVIMSLILLRKHCAAVKLQNNRHLDHGQMYVIVKINSHRLRFFVGH